MLGATVVRYPRVSNTSTGSPAQKERPAPMNAYGPSMQPRKLLSRLRTGNVANVKFGDLQTLVEACGFELDRVTGSHHIYRHPDIPVRLNLQNVRGQAKPYQVRQILRTLERYDLVPEDLE